MDKDRFRELLQSFEQLSVKPEADAEADIDSDAAGIEIPEQHSRRVLSIPRETAPPVQSDIEIFMSEVQDNSILFSELELTSTLPDIDAFKPNTMSRLTEGSSDATMRVSVQQQLDSASRFRFVAGMLAQLWSQADGMSRDRTAGKGSRTSLANIKRDMVTLCAASLAEAGQMEAHASAGKAQNGFGQRHNEDHHHKNLVGLSEPLQSDNTSTQKTVDEVTLGGRILEFSSSWTAVTADSWVLQTVAEGLRLDFAASPEPAGNTEAEYTLDDRAAIERVIRWDLGDKVIEEIPYRPELFVSHIYTLRIADDICLMHSSYDELVTQTTRLSRHLLGLGFLINSSTSNLEPLQSQRFLGFEFNTVEGMFYFPRDQIKKVRRAVHTARSTPITAKQLAALLGKVRSIMPAVGPDVAQICELEKCLDASIISPNAWDEIVSLSPSALAEINWLCDNILSLRSMPFSNSC
ncbi:hypothetical protein COEREDRAFT_85951 [Coemansia reversa NRRL 1564]|uniref:Uncharacterized protein n=1 Tax=Coemansia reversa (strain ATCC 12441 / NRRL 1564) TaxID=763665 RepID=A0A2G5BF99_COERN|nr:hypothetical protein COEREDRAFT_85951 [Coemansia reversa NRRL 1564]|eukprot:PIA17683.1 hypothetical protein COEREDRAFT_85951 [Coemansia reversa NRRL 1564]